MNRSELTQKLVQFSKPLGPFVSVEEREAQWLSWLAGMSRDVVPVLLDLLVTPPPPNEYAPRNWNEFEFDVTEALTHICRRDPLEALKEMKPLLCKTSARPGLIEVIGGLGVEEGLVWLKPLMNQPDMTKDEWIRLACALGEIGGEESRSLLEKMEKDQRISDPEILNEIKIALANS